LRRHYDRIHGLAWQLTGSRADADDIAQDVCCVLAEKLPAFRGDAKFTTWLCSIVYNACRDFRRRRKAFAGFTDRLAVMVGLMAAPDGRDLYDAVWIKSAIARLKPDLRDTAVLVAGQQLTHAEAALLMGVAEATISWRMHEVRRQLAKGSGPTD
jgi:RNA polymerase sigma-70 factor (ECF subfamily)